jgi:Protein of unknown function (DUF4238)
MEQIIQEPHHHHIQPIFYLRGFTSNEDPKRIWVFKRGMEYRPGRNKWNNPGLVSPRATGWEEDFYAVPKSYAPTDYSTIETDVLAKAEFAARTPIQRLRNGMLPTPDERKILAHYVILLWRRVKTYRNRTEDRWKSFSAPEIEKWRKAIQRTKEHPTTTTNHIQNLEKVEIILDEFAASDSVPKQIQNLMLQHRYEKMEDALFQMKWILLINKTGMPFITSDSPVYFWKSGLAISDISIPFSQDVALCATWRAKNDLIIHPSEKMVRMINRRSVTDSYEFAFASTKESWVLTILNKSPYSFERLH